MNEPMECSRSVVVALWAAGVMCASARAVDAAATLELYGNYHSMGIVVILDPGDDPDQDLIATVSHRTGSDPYAAGFSLTRTRDTQLVGSLFWLSPGTGYDVRVTLVDPDGGPLDGTTVSGTAATRAEIVIPPAAHSLVVSPTGSGTACTEPSPCPLDEGIAQAVAGDEVVLRGGVYFRGEISLPRSGSTGAPIVIRAFEGETPILDGSDPRRGVRHHRQRGRHPPRGRGRGAPLPLSEPRRPAEPQLGNPGVLQRRHHPPIPTRPRCACRGTTPR
jgi:hypothetical protein